MVLWQIVILWHVIDSLNLRTSFIEKLGIVGGGGTGEIAVVASISPISHLLVVFAVRVMGTFFI